MFIVQIIWGSSLFLLLAVEGMAEDMARALVGSHHEQIAGEPAGMARIRQQIFVASRELITHRQQCDVLWMRLLGLRGELEALVTGAREAAAYPTASSAAPALGECGSIAATAHASSGNPWGIIGECSAFIDYSGKLPEDRHREYQSSRPHSIGSGDANPQGISASGKSHSGQSTTNDVVQASARELRSVKRGDHGAASGIATGNARSQSGGAACNANGNLLGTGSCGAQASTSRADGESIIGCTSHTCTGGKTTTEQLTKGILSTWCCLKGRKFGESASISDHRTLAGKCCACRWVSAP